MAKAATAKDGSMSTSTSGSTSGSDGRRVVAASVRNDARIARHRKKQGHSSARSVSVLGCCDAGPGAGAGARARARAGAEAGSGSGPAATAAGPTTGAAEATATPTTAATKRSDAASAVNSCKNATVVHGARDAAAAAGTATNTDTATDDDDDDDVFLDQGQGCNGGGDADAMAVNMDDSEMNARDNAEARPIVLFFWNGLSSLLVCLRYLVSLDSIFSLVLSVGTTYFCYQQTRNDDQFDGSMDFILLGFAVLMPLSVSVRITFFRRERALESIAGMQTYAQHLYLCHACWDWGKEPGARSTDPDRWIEHSDEVLATLVSIGDELTRFLTLPNSSFSRHRETYRGRREAAVTIAASYRIFGNVIDRHVTRLALLLERLKLAGFSPSEASRVRQYEMLMTKAVHDLRMVKMYRSPKALHALLNLTTTLLPPFFSPAFAQIAHDSGSLGMGLAFAAITSMVLAALYESVQVLEDPFVAFLTLDGIDVYEELAVLYYHQLVQTRREIFPNAPVYMEEHMIMSSSTKKKDDSSVQRLDDEKFIDEGSGGSVPLDLRAMLSGQKKSSIRLTSSDHHRGRRRGSSLQHSYHRTSVYQLDLPVDPMGGSMTLRSSGLSMSSSGAGQGGAQRRRSSAGNALRHSEKGAAQVISSIKE